METLFFVPYLLSSGRGLGISSINPLLDGFHYFLVFGRQNFGNSFCLTADGLTVIEGNIGQIVRRFGSFYVNNNLIAKCQNA